MTEFQELQRWYDANKEGTLAGYSLDQVVPLAIAVGFSAMTVSQWETRMKFKAAI